LAEELPLEAMSMIGSSSALWKASHKAEVQRPVRHRWRCVRRPLAAIDRSEMFRGRQRLLSDLSNGRFHRFIAIAGHSQMPRDFSAAWRRPV
jgi:hypothetical protein